MAEARVALCRVRANRGAGTAMAAAPAEDALRLAPDDGGRLLLVRRVDLGRARRGPAGARALEARAAERLRDAASRAVHGGAPHAGAADVVWFRGEEEARRILLMRLLRGARCDAWFWRLLTPGPRGREAAAAVAAALAEAALSPLGEAALGRLLRALAEADLAGPFARLAAPASSPAPHLPAARPDALPPTAVGASPLDIEDAAALLRAAPAAIATSLVRALRIASARGEAPAALRRAAVLALAPGAAAAPARLAVLAEAIEHAAAVSAFTPPARPRPHASRLAKASRERSMPDPALPDVMTPTDPPASAEPGAEGAEPRDPPILGPAVDAPIQLPSESFSPVAGVFLLLRPLRRVGFDDWLVAHSDLALAGFGPCLLDHFAALAGARADDPIRMLLAPEDDARSQPDDLLRLWRRGLDGWLRRRARLHLAAVIARPGRLTVSDERLDLRWPLDAADLRLRRLALDADPGWTSWLGREVRFHFRDEPLA